MARVEEPMLTLIGCSWIRNILSPLGRRGPVTHETEPAFWFGRRSWIFPRRTRLQWIEEPFTRVWALMQPLQKSLPGAWTWTYVTKQCSIWGGVSITMLVENIQLYIIYMCVCARARARMCVHGGVYAPNNLAMSNTHRWCMIVPLQWSFF